MHLNEPKMGSASVPGATTRADDAGILWHTSSFPDFQKALSRIDRELHLAFDRALKLWVIYREGWVIRKASVPGEEAQIGYFQRMPSVVHTIAWVIQPDHTKPPKWILRNPDEHTLRTIRTWIDEERGMIEWDNSKAASKALMDHADNADARLDARGKEIWEEVRDDYKSRVDDDGNWKPMISVPREVAT